MAERKPGPSERYHRRKRPRAWNTRAGFPKAIEEPMPTKTSAGLQDSGTTDESTPENVEADPNLAELIERHEDTDWSETPGISAAEAGAWTARLIEARETVQEDL